MLLCVLGHCLFSIIGGTCPSCPTTYDCRHLCVCSWACMRVCLCVCVVCDVTSLNSNVQNHYAIGMVQTISAMQRLVGCLKSNSLTCKRCGQKLLDIFVWQ